MNKHTNGRSDVSLIPFSPAPDLPLLFYCGKDIEFSFQGFLFDDLIYPIFVFFVFSNFFFLSLNISILTVPVIYRNITGIDENLKSFEFQYKDYYYLLVSSL